LNKVGGISTKDLYRLFPEGPAKKAAKISGLPKPQGCV
jgi:tRNA 2-thiouridine synthesizing protein E